MAQYRALRARWLGPQVHPDLGDLHLFLVRTDQGPQWRLEHYQLARQLDPDVGDRPATAWARSVLAALSRAASPHAMVLFHRRADSRCRLVAAGPCAARRRDLLDGIPRFHGGDLVYPLRADGDLLAGLRSARAPWSLA